MKHRQETTEQFQQRLSAHLEKLLVDGMDKMRGILEAHIASESHRLTALEKAFAQFCPSEDATPPQEPRPS